MILEIRTRDLRFTPEESAAYLELLIPNLSDQKAFALLEKRFEGWPAGLHLAALTLRPKDSQDSVIQALSDENMNITAYLVSEVIYQQLPVIQDFLLNTSILDRFCIQLCEAVMAGTDSNLSVRDCLDAIESSELFLIPLDNHREWYRYHQLFQELLQQRLSTRSTPERIAKLHRMASTWFIEQDLLEEAVQHALAAGDTDLAVRQMVSGSREVINKEDRLTLDRWLMLLPENMIQKDPELLMLRAWSLEFSWQLVKQAQVIHQIEEILDSENSEPLQGIDLEILRGQILLIEAQQAYFSNQTTQAIEMCRRVLQIFPSEWKFIRGGAMLFLGMAMQANGQARDAERMILEDYGSYLQKSDTYAQFLQLSLSFIYLNIGRLDDVRKIAGTMHRAASSSGIHLRKNWADWFLGIVSYQRNELEDASLYFDRIIENPFSAQITTYRDAVAGLAVIYQINGQSQEAKQMVELISQFDLEMNGVEDLRTSALNARVMLLQGNLAGAGRWADSISEFPPDQPLMWFEEPQLTRAKILIIRAKNDDLRVATQILDILEEIARRTFNTRFMVEILALQALANKRVGKNHECDILLIQALELAQPGDIIRVFLDQGELMRVALRAVVNHEGLGGFIRHILAAFPAQESSPDEPQNAVAKSGNASKKNNQDLIEPLTPRELEILELLRSPMSIKEIANSLNISYATAKRHTSNLYAETGREPAVECRCQG